MSTRSVIARTTDKGRTFSGVYHHWDGYPAGLGAQLLELYHGHFKRDLAAMLQELIDEHPAGWSSILCDDWTLPPEKDLNDRPCAVCGWGSWWHYRQYYVDGAPRCTSHQAPAAILSDEMRAAPAGTSVLGHRFEAKEEPHGPTPYYDEPVKITQNNASNVGCEYAYAFDEAAGMLYVLSSYCPNGAKMIGMFGCGDPNATWRVFGIIDLKTTLETALKCMNAMDPYSDTVSTCLFVE